MIIDAHAWYLSKDDIERGESEGWLKEHYQSSARQAGGGSRTGKYKALLFGIPDRCYEGGINFNVVPEDWEEEEEED